MREIGVEVKSSLVLPPKKEMEGDVRRLQEYKRKCRKAIKHNQEQIEKQKKEKKNLLRLVKNPKGEDGITYNKEACAEAAKRCDKHIGMFKALNKKEKEKIDQLDYMIGEVEERICLSEQMSL